MYLAKVYINFRHQLYALVQLLCCVFYILCITGIVPYRVTRFTHSCVCLQILYSSMTVGGRYRSIPNWPATCATTSPVKWVSLSAERNSGITNLGIISLTRRFTTVLASQCKVGNALTHLVKRSVITSISFCLSIAKWVNGPAGTGNFPGFRGVP